MQQDSAALQVLALLSEIPSKQQQLYNPLCAIYYPATSLSPIAAFHLIKLSRTVGDIMLSRAALRSARAPGVARKVVGRTAKVCPFNNTFNRIKTAEL